MFFLVQSQGHNKREFLEYQLSVDCCEDKGFIWESICNQIMLFCYLGQFCPYLYKLKRLRASAGIFSRSSIL